MLYGLFISAALIAYGCCEIPLNSIAPPSLVSSVIVSLRPLFLSLSLMLCFYFTQVRSLFSASGLACHLHWFLTANFLPLFSFFFIKARDMVSYSTAKVWETRERFVTATATQRRVVEYHRDLFASFPLSFCGRVLFFISLAFTFLSKKMKTSDVKEGVHNSRISFASLLPEYYFCIFLFGPYQ